jgi:pimeloyl-ACP methyl ester carboxylesterase
MAVATPVTRPFPRIEGVSHRFVDAAGLRMHVAEAGEGDPVLLLHGWPQHWYEWRHQIPVLARHYHVICPDLRGFGWSEAPPGGYEKENLAADVLNLLDALGLERPVKLIGHDWGGWAGFLICLHHPERVERFLALNITPPWGKADLRTLSALWRFWYQYLIASPLLGSLVLKNMPQFVRYFIRGTSAEDAWSDDDLAAFTEPLREPERAHASVQLYRTFLLREFPSIARGRYASLRLTTPTLLLFGTKDFAISTRFLRGYEPFVDDFTLELVPDAGHFIAEEKPEMVNERALEFFSAAPPL